MRGNTCAWPAAAVDVVVHVVEAVVLVVGGGQGRGVTGLDADGPALAVPDHHQLEVGKRLQMSGDLTWGLGFRVWGVGLGLGLGFRVSLSDGDGGCSIAA